jgi:hypothetical protein
MNFSGWTSRHPNSGEIIGNIEEGDMPPAIYQLQHPTVRLSGTEENPLIREIQASIP